MLPVSPNRGSDNPEVLALKGEKFPLNRHTRIQLNWKLKLPPGWLLMPLNQYIRKGVTVLAGVSDTDYQGETGLLLYNEDKEGMYGIQRSLRGSLIFIL